MADHRKKRLVPLGVGALTVTVAVSLLVVAQEPLLKWWYRLELDRAGPEERWELAGDYEESGAVAREMVEDWYVDVLRSWKPDEVAISSRAPLVQNGNPLRYFYYPDEKDIARAALRLGALGSVKAIPVLVAYLERSDPELPRMTPMSFTFPPPWALGLHVSSLALFQLRAKSVDALIEAAGSEKKGARFQATEALSRLFEAGIGGDRALDAIGDRTLPVRSRVFLLSALRLDRSLPADVVERALLDSLNDESRDIRVQTTHAIRTVGCRSPETVQSLGQILRGDAEWKARHGATRALGRLGQAAKGALQQIRAAALDDPDVRVRGSAREALEKLGEK